MRPGDIIMVFPSAGLEWDKWALPLILMQAVGNHDTGQITPPPGSLSYFYVEECQRIQFVNIKKKHWINPKLTFFKI